ncbi:MAG: NAD(P)-binding domain-containing protein [Thermoanaerobaculia bacterium]|nr:NAD(P)-binding domain-containing protein [Thermoanaerobaculia bacterium]
MKKTNTVIIGAGQAGLALSRCLFDRGVEHVILERGRVAQRWSERWDSLRLLSPNWMTRLPGWSYRGDQPDGFMARNDVVRFLSGYAASFDAPVEEQTPVTRVAPLDGGWVVETDRGSWRADSVAVATGHSQETRVPKCAEGLPKEIAQVATSAYRIPDQLPEGGVLVVGASASGVQLADELLGSGRDVTIAVGRHTRVPRSYRGRDIMYWLDRTGALQRPLSDMPDALDAKREPSLQLVADDFGRSLDLARLAEQGARIAGRLVAIDGTRVRFQSDLAQLTTAADYQMGKLLARIDRHIDAHGVTAQVGPAAGWSLTPRFEAAEEIDLERKGIRSVVWATGYRRDYSWLHANVLDARGELWNSRGVTPAPGLYVLGLQFMIRRNSSFIDGVGRDAEEIATAIARRARARTREAA